MGGSSTTQKVAAVYFTFLYAFCQLTLIGFYIKIELFSYNSECLFTEQIKIQSFGICGKRAIKSVGCISKFLREDRDISPTKHCQ